MGTAIKEQISLDRDAMVDALYPVIGSTISKYMAEAIKAINEKVENTLAQREFLAKSAPRCRESPRQNSSSRRQCLLPSKRFS
jgi:hypothetical protein